MGIQVPPYAVNYAPQFPHQFVHFIGMTKVEFGFRKPAKGNRQRELRANRLNAFLRSKNVQAMEFARTQILLCGGLLIVRFPAV